MAAVQFFQIFYVKQRLSTIKFIGYEELETVWLHDVVKSYGEESILDQTAQLEQERKRIEEEKVRKHQAEEMERQRKQLAEEKKQKVQEHLRQVAAAEEEEKQKEQRKQELIKQEKVLFNH